MSNCDYCGAEVELPFKCNFCGSVLCMEHRLPENHACSRQPSRTPLGSWQSKNTLRAKKSKPKIIESEGDFHFKKKTPFSYEPQRRQYKTEKRKKGISVGKAVSLITVVFGLSVIVLLIVLSLGGFGPSSINISQTEDEIFQGINEERTSRGLPILGNDIALVSISNSWSNQLASMDTLTHGDFEGRIASIGYSYYSCGEIIGSYTSGSVNGIPITGSSSELAKEFVDMWLNSPPHREIMLTASSGFMGVGLSKNGSTFYGVVDFRFG